MSMVSFEIPVRMDSGMSLNKIYGGKHWSERKRDAEQVHSLIKLILNAIGKTEVFPCPVHICIEYNCRLDIDNCGYMSKLIIDGMKGLPIKNDSPKYVQGLSQSFWNGDGIRVTLMEDYAWKEAMENGRTENVRQDDC